MQDKQCHIAYEKGTGILNIEHAEADDEANRT